MIALQAICSAAGRAQNALPERNVSFMKIKNRYALAAAAACALLLAGCGDNSSANGAAEAGTRITRETVTSRETTTPSMTTENTTATSPPEATSDQTTERKPLSTPAPHTTTSAGTSTTAPGLIDRAESALDSIGDAITSMLTEATRPVH